MTYLDREAMGSFYSAKTRKSPSKIFLPTSSAGLNRNASASPLIRILKNRNSSTPSFGTRIALPCVVDTEVHMSYESIPLLILLAVLLIAGILFIIDGIRRQIGDRKE